MPNPTKVQMEMFKRQTMDSPTSDFATKVRKNLIRKGFFKPFDKSDEHASRKPLTPTSTQSAPSPE